MAWNSETGSVTINKSPRTPAANFELAAHRLVRGGSHDYYGRLLCVEFSGGWPDGVGARRLNSMRHGQP